MTQTHPKLKTKNQKPINQKPETINQKPETINQKPETINQIKGFFE